MLIGFGTDRPEASVHLDQAAIIPLGEGNKEDEAFTDIVAAVQYKGEELRDNQMDRHKKV